MRTSLALLLALTACAAEVDDPDFYAEGEVFDRHGRTSLDADDVDKGVPYEEPELPELVAPEVIVSLDGLTVHLFDRATGFNRVYPAGVGVLGRSGQSITPTGHFATSDDTDDGWYYIASRWTPSYFEGYPFLRLDAKNSRGQHTYGLHGPITDPLRRDYVSHGCVRMAKPDIVEVFFAVASHPSTRVTIQKEVELDAEGQPVDVGTEPALFAPDEVIPYGASVGPHPDDPQLGFVGAPCAEDAECMHGGFCHEAGFCTVACAGYCPDRAGVAGTFCVTDPADEARGICTLRVDPSNHECATVPGSMPAFVARHVGDSDVTVVETDACVPVASDAGT